MNQEEREKILESTHRPKEIWDQCIVTPDGQVFTPDDETGESAEEVYNKHLSNIGKDTPNQMEVCLNELSEYVLNLEMKSLDLEETSTMNSEYVLDLDTRLTNVELQK